MWYGKVVCKWFASWLRQLVMVLGRVQDRECSAVISRIDLPATKRRPLVVTRLTEPSCDWLLLKCRWSKASVGPRRAFCYNMETSMVEVGRSDTEWRNVEARRCVRPG
jgi:hypothetical protein